MDGEQPVSVLEDLLAAKGEHLLRTAVLLAGSHEEGEDLLQAALERVFRRWRTIRGDPEGYLRRTMYHLAADGWRRRGAWRARLGLLRTPEALSDATDAVDRRDHLVRLLRELPPRQRAAIVLRYWEELTEAEAARPWAALSASAGERRDALHVVRHREGVERAQVFQGPAALEQQPEVAGERGGVAGYVREPLRRGRVRTGSRRPPGPARRAAGRRRRAGPAAARRAAAPGPRRPGARAPTASPAGCAGRPGRRPGQTRPRRRLRPRRRAARGRRRTGRRRSRGRGRCPPASARWRRAPPRSACRPPRGGPARTPRRSPASPARPRAG